MSDCALAIDLGTSGPKVGLVEAEGRVIGSASAPTALSILPDGGAEQDPHDWWRAITTASQQLAARFPAEMARVAAVATTAQWSGTVAVDDRGVPLRPALIWMDARGAAYIDALTKGLINIEGYGVTKLLRWIRITGGAPGRSGKDPIAHILWMKHREPELYARTHRFLEPKDWINHRLCGRFASTFETIALHWVTDNRDLSKVAYHDGLMKAAGLDREKLPDLIGAHAVLGEVTREAAEVLGIPAGALVVGGTPDMHSAALGSGALEDYAAHLYVGTSSWIGCHVPFKKTDLLHNIASLPSALPHRYFVAATQESAGVCVSRFLDEWVYPEDELGVGARPADAFARLEAAVNATAPGADKLLFAPWLYGERAPVEDRSVRGGFINMSLGTTRRHMARAVHEGVAFNTRWLMGHVESFIGRRIDELAFIGGGARSTAWCQIFADVLDRPIAQTAAPLEANVRGAAMLARAALGHLDLAAPTSQLEVARTFEPRAEHRSLYDDLYGAFGTMYKRTRPLYQQLNAVPKP